MDLRAYYRKLRGIEAELSEDSVVIISRETSDGGRAGVKGDVPRALGARLIADEKADLASAAEAAAFRAEVEAKWKASHLSQCWPVKNPPPDACGTLKNPLHRGRASSTEADRATTNAPREKV